MVAWWDAQTLSTITKDGSDEVSQWRDRSANAYNLGIDAGTSHAQYDATALSGGTKPGITVLGLPLYVLSVPMGVSQFGVFMVLKLPTVTGRAVFSFQGDNTGNGLDVGSFGIMSDWSDATVIQCWRENNSSDPAASVTVASAGTHRLALIFDATTGRFYVDGVASSPITFNATLDATGTFWMGSLPVGFGSQQPIGEVFVVKSPTSGQIAAADAYLSGRW